MEFRKRSLIRPIGRSGHIVGEGLVEYVCSVELLVRAGVEREA